MGFEEIKNCKKFLEECLEQGGKIIEFAENNKLFIHNDNKIKNTIEKYRLIIVFENYKIHDLFNILGSNKHLEPHLKNYRCCIKLLNDYYISIKEFCDLANYVRERGQTNSLIIKIEKMIDSISQKYIEFSKFSEDTLIEIATSIEKLNDKKKDSKTKKKVFLGASITTTIIGVGIIVAGIVLSPITAGFSLLSTIEGVALIASGGGGAAALSVTFGFFSKHQHSKERNLGESIAHLIQFSRDVKSFVAIFENNPDIKEKIKEDFDFLMDSELQLLSLFCIICNDILKDPVIIYYPNNEDGEIYCRNCITDFYNREHKKGLDAYLPINSNIKFTPQSFCNPDMVTRKNIKIFEDKIKKLEEKIQSIGNNQTMSLKNK